MRLIAQYQMRAGLTWTVVATALLVAAQSGCTSISIAPSCPNELAVGESGAIDANQQDEGEIATYVWEVFPSGAGTIANSQASATAFTALLQGRVILRLTASDGLFQTTGDCTINVVARSDGNDNDNSNTNANDNGSDPPVVRR